MTTVPPGGLLARDYKSLSLFRIAFSLYLLLDFLVHDFFAFAELYGPTGMLPASVLAADARFASNTPFGAAMRILDYSQPQVWFPTLYLLSVAWFGVGYRTRLANALLLALNVYLYWRNPFVKTGAETLARLMLLWCLFLPMSRYWSVDAILHPEHRERHYPAFPFVAIRLQLCSVYVFGALFKLLGSPWRDGSAVALALSDTLFGNTAVGSLLVRELPLLLVFTTYAVTVFQLALPLLVYAPWHNDLLRALAIAGAAALHVSFIFCLSIGSFPFLSLVMLLLLVPDRWIDRALERWSMALKVVLAGHPPPNAVHRIAARPPAIRIVNHAQVFACGFLLTVATGNNVMSIARSLDGDPFALTLPTAFDKLTAAFLVRQNWALFAPMPVHFRWEYALSALAADGSTRSMKHVIPDPPIRQNLDGSPWEFTSSRWQKFLSHITWLNEEEWNAFREFLCREANTRFSGVRSLELTVTLRPVAQTGVSERSIHREFVCSMFQDARMVLDRL